MSHPSLAALRPEVITRLSTGGYPTMNLHLLSEHGCVYALTFTEASAEDQHTHEHTTWGGPDHDINDATWSAAKAATVIMDAIFEAVATENEDPRVLLDALLASPSPETKTVLLNVGHWTADRPAGEPSHMTYRRIRDALDHDPLAAMFASPLVERLANAVTEAIVGKIASIAAPEVLTYSNVRRLAQEVIWASPLSLLHHHAQGNLADQVRDALFPLTAAHQATHRPSIRSVL